ncbi:MAG: hypothetical protein AB7L76_15705 [Burkholderiaceae bacterium]
MAQIVLGLGTTHSPMLNLSAGQWRHRANVDQSNASLALSDGRRLSYAELQAERGARFVDQLEPAKLEAKAAACHAALDRLADALERAAPDVVLIVGDDQSELFSADCQPTFAIYHGETIVTTIGKYGKEAPAWMLQIGKGFLMDDHHSIAGAPEFAVRLIEGLMEHGADVTAVASVRDPSRAGFGHAYGFIVKRLLRRPVPIVPVLLNTYYPPNVPTASRCLDLGHKLRAVVEAMPGPTRVALVASGGLSHFVVDEDLDRAVLAAFRDKDDAALRRIPQHVFRSGTSETLNWILLAGAVTALPLQMAEYHALYRTEVGTGVGAGFCIWAHEPLPASPPERPLSGDPS